MKELSIEEKAEAYDKAIERAKEINREHSKKGFKPSDDVLYIFPELKESEDEKIKKALIRYHKSTVHIDGIKGDKIVSWLEKQGEQKTFCDKCRKEQPSQSCQDITALGRCALEKQDLQNLDNSAKTCKDEQKPDDNKGMNLVEEKMTPFQKKVFGIIDLDVEEEQGLKQVCDELLRLAYDEIMQKSAKWSEDDEKIVAGLNNCIDELEEVNGWKFTYVNDENVELCKIRNWLKSIKDRYTWKPSEEQLEALDDFIYAKYPNIEKHGASVKSLYQDLKKLIEE